MAKYSIKDFERLSGIKAHTIRIWEKRFALLEPKRTDTNIRYYSDEDLRKILNVASLVKNGHKISKIAELCEESLRDEILKIEDQQSSPNLKIDQLTRLMISLSTVDFEHAINRLFEEFGVEKAFMKVLFPFLEKIGLLWQIGSIVPAHEHFVSNLIRSKLINETEKLPGNTSSKSILFFLKEGELHEISSLFFNFLARKNGYNTIYLGVNVPLHDLKEVSEKYNFDAVTTIFVNAISKEELEKYIQQITSIFEGKEIFISGLQIKINEPEFSPKIKIVSNPEMFISSIAML